jgi:hypothetical protein
MPVNVDLLKKHAAQFKMSKENAVEYYKQLFSKHKDVAEAYGADGIDVDSVGKSQKFIMLAMNELQCFFSLPGNYGNERQWRTALSGFKEHYGDSDIPLKLFNKTTEPFLATMQKHAGGVNAEQKKSWEELLKQAYNDMKTWGWL